MPYNSLTREAVCSSSELINFGATFCNSGVPSGRIEEEMVSVFVFKG